MKREEGQAMVEFALILPILILVLAGIIDFGWLFGNHIVASNACRDAARYTAVHYADNPAGAETNANNRIVADLPSGVFTDVATNLNKSGDTISLSFSGNIEILTPVLLFALDSDGDGKYKVQYEYAMRVE